MELVARSGGGLSLADVAKQLDSPKSSIQELTNGLVASGYLVESSRRLVLGAGPFVLALMGNRLAAMSLSHEMVQELYSRVGDTVLIGVPLGDSIAFVDHAGEKDGMGSVIEFVARTHARRPMLATASGKIALSEMSSVQMDAILVSAQSFDKALVDAFLHELPGIKATGLAYNMGTTIEGVSVVATALRDSKGQFIASVSSARSTLDAADMALLGERLVKAVESLEV